MIGLHVPAVVVNEVVRIAAPDVLEEQVHDQPVVHTKSELRVSLDRIG